MTRAINFSAGPAALPLPALQQAKEELLDWNSVGASVMEISHRSREFMDLAQQTETDLRELLTIPQDYSVLFVQGGAQTQFSMVPLNLLSDKNEADYIDTGYWSQLAIKEARRYAEVNVAASAEANGFTDIPRRDSWQLNPDAAYVHYTPNETITGVEFHWIPDVGEVPLVADMSSTILSRPLDVGRYGLIYAGAQKNIGPAGITVVIVRHDLLGRTSKSAPKLFDYQQQTKAGSMMNTVPTFNWYMVSLVLKWLKQQGGLSRMGEVNQRKARTLYECIDESGGFYRNRIAKKCRSWMNVTFDLGDSGVESVFLEESERAGLIGLKGHRAVGGMRASIYNAMPQSGVDVLVNFMQDFQARHG
ncbi:MAG: 3-phosphoserine/phosphohydroxythreonine transaminase [Arenicellales bacterium]|nr:3-phosphoserine/phosphohydroxythreonine transaminase [Arenicellales bacterium]